MRMTTYSNPRQTLLVTCRHEGKDNIITLDWHTPLSFNPKMYAISVGQGRFSHNMIKDSEVFAVNFMSKDYEEEIYFCGSKSGVEVDKFKETTFEKEECEEINCPRIKQSIAFFECKVVNQMEVGDHTLFIGKVVNEGSSEEEKRLFHLHSDKFTTTEEKG